MCLTPPKEAGTETGKLRVLKHCLYGLNDAAREFYYSVVDARPTSRFMAVKLEVGSFGSVGFTIIQNEQGIVMDQSECLASLEAIVLPPEKASQKHRSLDPCDQTQLRQIVGRLNWIVQGCRPDLAFEAGDLSTKFSDWDHRWLDKSSETGT